MGLGAIRSPSPRECNCRSKFRLRKNRAARRMSARANSSWAGPDGIRAACPLEARSESAGSDGSVAVQSNCKVLTLSVRMSRDSISTAHGGREARWHSACASPAVSSSATCGHTFMLISSWRGMVISVSVDYARGNGHGIGSNFDRLVYRQTLSRNQGAPTRTGWAP